MSAKKTTAWCMLAAWLYPMMCYGFVLLSSAAAGAGEDIQDSTYTPGGSWTYELMTTALLNEPDVIGKHVGFRIMADVKVESVWRSTARTGDRLLKFELLSPKLFIKSRKAPDEEGFMEHTSKLEELTNSPFFVHWYNGMVQSLYIPLKEPLAIVNLKKGIASLFQFHLLDQQVNETDASGRCQVTYRSTSPLTFSKIKEFCVSDDFPYQKHPDPLFSLNTESLRTTDYKMSPNNKYIDSIVAVESHAMRVAMKPDAGNEIKLRQELKFKSESETNVITAEGVNDALQLYTNQLGNQFTHETLLTEKEQKSCADGLCTKLGKIVDEFADDLKTYGTVKAANSFLKALSIARETNKDDIIKVLKKIKSKSTSLAFYDILGSAQTLEAHEAAMKQLRFTDEKHFNKIERYLWSLSMGAQPKLDIIKDLLNKYFRTPDLNENLQETLLLTIGAMTDKYTKNPHNLERNKIYQSVKEAFYNGIENCDKKPCQYTFIRALKNLKSTDTIPKLIDLALNGADKSSVVAMKALASFSPSTWNEDVIKAVKVVFFQIRKKHDSSSRTLSLDILLGSNPDEQLVEELLWYLLSNDKAFEVKKYVMQKLLMLSEKDPEFKQLLRKVLRKDVRLHNYAIASQKGMSTALARQFMKHSAINGSMVSVQEMSSGLVKRGVFDVVFENQEKSCEMFSLGLFSGGLGSFISSDEEETAGDDEQATAGMELTMLGTQIRPFVFFTGQGELMGHVWSGTASESTPAFQINTLVHDHLEYIRLGSGFVAELNLQTAVSFNLAGEIQISLWNRNSHSLVNQNAAMMMNGLLRLDTEFVKSKIEFQVSSEPKLNLESDIEFGSGVAVCLRLTQPSALFKHNVFKIERIPGSKHSLRIARYRKYEIPGRTYNLNQKNNDMCSTLMRDR